MRSIDVLPTIADVLGVKLPWKVDGTSALRSRREEDIVRVLHWPRVDQLEPRPDDDLPTCGRASRRRCEPRSQGEGGAPLALTRSDGSEVWSASRSSSSLPRPPPPFTARLDKPDRWTHVDPRAAEIPVYVSGKIKTREPVAVVVSVNGIVGGWSETFKELARGFFGERNRRTSSP